MKIQKGDKITGGEKVDKYRAIFYAGASGDFNPIHIDPEFGKSVGLGGAILHGMCTLGFTARTVTDWAGDPGKLKKIRCRFSAPVMMEDSLAIEGEVLEVRDGMASIGLSVKKQTGQEVLTNVSALVEI